MRFCFPRRGLFLIGLVFASLFVIEALAHAGDVYRWRDAKGVFHFGDRPPLAGAFSQLERWPDKSASNAETVTVLTVSHAPLSTQTQAGVAPTSASTGHSWVRVPLVEVLSAKEQAALKA